MARRAWTILLGLALGLVASLLGPASPASAHAVLVGTSPGMGSTVQDGPNQVVLTFTEGIEPIAGRNQVIAPDGSREDTDQARAAGTQLIIPLRATGKRGTYLVTYRVLSADSHPVAGSFTYSVGAPSPGGPPTADTGGDASSAIRTIFPVMRWIGYVGLLLLVGAVLVLAVLWPQRLDRTNPMRVIWLGAGLVAAATIGELVLQVPYVSGGGLGDIRGADIRDVLASPFGTAHLIRLGVLAAALVLVRPIVRGRGWGADRVLLAVLATIAIATWPVSGHPSASPAPMVTVLADMVHLASMSVWLGGLVMLIAFLLRQANGTELGAIVPVWSRWAGYAVGALVLTGVAQALIEVGSLDALVSTTYGWLVLAKVGLVVGLVGVASVSRRIVMPITNEEEGAAARLRTVVIIEAVIAAAVLGVASVLVQTTPARTAVTQTEAPTIQDAILADPLFTLTVDMQPSTVGQNEIHLYAATPDGRPSDVQEWRVRASMPSEGIEPIDAAVLRLTPDHATATINLPIAGSWTLNFTIRVSEVDQATVTTVFQVR
jgi:copper transport protein